ncbi:hypothetical protein BD626DRAFT_575322 [Schizophyllum amplum]|uniref:Uncharacterized protein n=1 Tax=Schizophyllum amplum TaxID=97359 RepID=A0A550BW14_9AGAR|nr:hypothetical protein BD626DRAFT_575322 [Auriculariopsis ampla]
MILRPVAGISDSIPGYLIQDALESTIHTALGLPAPSTLAPLVHYQDLRRPVPPRVASLVSVKSFDVGHDPTGQRLSFAQLPFCALAVALHGTIPMRVAEAGGLLVLLRAHARSLAERAVVGTKAELRPVVVPHWLGLNQSGGLQAWARVLVGDDRTTKLDGQTVRLKSIAEGNFVSEKSASRRS